MDKINGVKDLNWKGKCMEYCGSGGRKANNKRKASHSQSLS